MRISGRRARAALFVLAACGSAFAGPATAGSFDLFGITTDYKLTLGYAIAARTEDPNPELIRGPVDQMQIDFTPAGSLPTGNCATPPCIGSFRHTGLPIMTNFDDGNRDFKKYAPINHRVSAYGETQIKLDQLGFGNIGLVGSGAAHWDQVFHENNDHDNPASVNRGTFDENGDRVGPVNEWTDGAVTTNGERYRLLEAYAYGEWYLTDTIGLALRAGRHLAAWGESLFFPGIVSAQGPFDATKAFVPGAEVKEILLPVNQVSMQLALTQNLTVLAYNQFEFGETEIFPQGDFFSPADLVGPGSTFGYGSINPIHPEHCAEPTVTDATTGEDISDQEPLCSAPVQNAFENQPEYIYTLRTEDLLPGDKDQWGLGAKYQLTPNLNLGGYYLRYHNHNPHVLLNMGYARVGEASGGGPTVTTQQFGVRVPVSYTVGYADNVEMTALSFSTVWWVFNVGGEIIHRENIDTSLEATIAGVVAPYTTRGNTNQYQMSLLYVNNPDFLMYDEVVVVTELGFLTVAGVNPVQNQDGVCMSGTEPDDCDSDGPFEESGSVLFYDEDSWAFQTLVLPKGRNVFPGWDIGTPIAFSWLVDGTPSTPGVFGPLYGEGDMRLGVSVSAQYLQNLEFTVSYNAFMGEEEKFIGRSTLKANPYMNHDYASFAIKYNL